MWLHQHNPCHLHLTCPRTVTAVSKVSHSGGVQKVGLVWLFCCIVLPHSVTLLLLLL